MPHPVRRACNSPREPTKSRTNAAISSAAVSNAKMPGIENVHLSFRNILAVALWFAEVKREVILAPDHQQARLLLVYAGLPPGIVVDVGAVVVEEVALNLDLAGLIEKSKFIGPQIGVIAFHGGIASDMARPRRLQRQGLAMKRVFVGGARSAQKARRVFQIAPRLSLCATASWTMRPSIRSGWVKAIRKPTGPP